MKTFISMIPCHRRPDRSLHIKGRPLPLCARCTAIYGAYIFLPLFYFVPHTWAAMVTAVLLQGPMFIDGYTQLKKWRESNNALRVITGLLSGFGQCLFIWCLADLIIRILDSI